MSNPTPHYIGGVLTRASAIELINAGQSVTLCGRVFNNVADLPSEAYCNAWRAEVEERNAAPFTSPDTRPPLAVAVAARLA